MRKLAGEFIFPQALANYVVRERVTNRKEGLGGF
jgi:hypothetical protein